MLHHSKHLSSHIAETDCIVSRCGYVKQLDFNYKFGWETGRAEQRKNPWQILKPHFSQNFPVLLEPSNPLSELFPRSPAGWLEPYILGLRLAQVTWRVRSRSCSKIDREKEHRVQKIHKVNNQSLKMPRCLEKLTQKFEMAAEKVVNGTCPHCW